MGKAKKNHATEVKKEEWFGSGVEIDPKLDNVKITFTSNKLEEANKVLKDLKLPEFDSDGNPIL